MWGFVLGFLVASRPKVVGWIFFWVLMLGAIGLFSDVAPGTQYILIFGLAAAVIARYVLRARVKRLAVLEVEERAQQAQHDAWVVANARRADMQRAAGLNAQRQAEFDKFERWKMWAEWHASGRPDAPGFGFVDDDGMSQSRGAWPADSGPRALAYDPLPIPDGLL